MVWPPGACTRVTVAFPPPKGGDAVRFFATPPREVRCIFVFLRPLAFVVLLRADYDSEVLRL